MAALTWDRLLDDLRRDNRSGATELTRRAAAGLATLAEVVRIEEQGHDRLRAALRELATVRPPFASLFRVANEAAQATSNASSAADAATALRQLAARLLGELSTQHAAVVAATAELIVGSPQVLTISASTLVRDALIRATARGSGPRVTWLESRPGLEGVTPANELAGAGMQTRLAVDAAAARLAAEGDLVLVGADTFSPTGLVHKLGTLGLALAAGQRRLPVYALLGSFKILPAPVRGWQQDGGPAAELGLRTSPGVEIWNRYYDLTPFDLLAGVVTEQGLHAPPQAAALAPPIHAWLSDLLERRP
jgi:translation initiation factor 2B subunit (eIF-2B alpha/beta/delta family)